MGYSATNIKPKQNSNVVNEDVEGRSSFVEDEYTNGTVDLSNTDEYDYLDLNKTVRLY